MALRARAELARHIAAQGQGRAGGTEVPSSPREGPNAGCVQGLCLAAAR